MAAGFEMFILTGVMLVLAAATCGLFWGWLYLRFRSVIILVVSHVLWDLAIFLFAPLAG